MLKIAKPLIQHFEQLKEDLKKPQDLLRRAKYELSNEIGHCMCTAKNPCQTCRSRTKLYDEIEEYLKCWSEEG